MNHDEQKAALSSIAFLLAMRLVRQDAGQKSRVGRASEWEQGVKEVRLLVCLECERSCDRTKRNDKH
jgi:hypothetical protein